MSYAEQCIVRQNGTIREWTAGKFISPKLEVGEEIKDFTTYPQKPGVVLRYENGDMVTTDILLPVVDEKKEILKKLLQDQEIKDIIKAIK
jgi:hypothetical protein